MAIGEYLTYFSELKESFFQIGGLIPSSPALAKAMIEPIRHSSKPLSILEAGPGTGPMTKQILKYMKPQDRLLICEINPRFLASLKKRLQKNRYYLAHKDRVEFFEGPVQDLRKQANPMKFDIIVSSLPFSFFPASVVDEILELFRSLIKENGTLTFCEYLGFRKLSFPFSSAERREQIIAVENVLKKWTSIIIDNGKVTKDIAWLNFPPAKTIRYEYLNGVNGHHATQSAALQNVNGSGLAKGSCL